MRSLGSFGSLVDPISLYEAEEQDSHGIGKDIVKRQGEVMVT